MILGIIFGASFVSRAESGHDGERLHPRAVLSITVLKYFRKPSVCAATIPNNIVQTTGSGESIAFGVAVTMPPHDPGL